ncbi:MAG TPA: tRNA pseudouridine(55) synthase TruB [Atopostipes sp.]|nr:tRNA pseudouridine(55) synthase TruB [Atopostipes sp.]
MVEGILPVWKEKGMTSFACVREVRRLLGIKKVGHAGTLDPEVDGVLPIAIGPATKVLEFMLEADKTYTGEITLGYSTSTEDATGQVIEKKAVSERIKTEEIDEVLKQFQGVITQKPPMFSAVKVKGKRLYEYAFEGLEVARPSREVEIKSLTRTSEPILDEQSETIRFSFEVSCSKGTYIRTLAVDIGKRLGYPAHMSQLTRIRSGEISSEQTSTLSEIEKAVTEGTIENLLLPIDYGLNQFMHIKISDSLWNRVKNGAILDEEDLEVVEFPVLLIYKETVVALYDKHPNKPGKLKPKKVFKIEM